MSEKTSIIDFQVGLRVAVRSGYQSWYGRFEKITPTTAVVKLDDGAIRRFSRNSRFEIGSTETRYKCPYLCTVSEAVAKDREYALATERAGQRLNQQVGV